MYFKTFTIRSLIRLQSAQSHEDQSDSRGIVLSNVVAEREVLTNVLRSGQRTQRLHQYCQMKIHWGCILNQAIWIFILKSLSSIKCVWSYNDDVGVTTTMTIPYHTIAWLSFLMLVHQQTVDKTTSSDIMDRNFSWMGQIKLGTGMVSTSVMGNTIRRVTGWLF